MEKISVTEIYGSNVFNDASMAEYLPKKMYAKFKELLRKNEPLDFELAGVVAHAMKEWAISKGATHYSHWFQPMTGVTAEKHDAFISPTGDGRAIMEFSGKELIKGESDASSFPSGGLRATFEARGYTTWDYTSPAFLKEDASGVTLCIPTAFCSYTGEALDKKTPILRSMEALNKQALRILRTMGDTESKSVTTSVGAEQEYFLIDTDLYDKRKDLIFTGRTLFGAKPPKGQELDDHYYGPIKERVACYMHELNIVLWKLGIAAKTQHNEVAPAQHELAPIYDETNIAVDHNQLIMEYMKKVASRHGFVCLLHEKPFEGFNGSGKHNNWSLTTDLGKNLLKPGKNPAENLKFLIFFVSVIEAVDKYADLLRLSASNPGNDHRLGANEAPPAIISIFVGEDLLEILEGFEKGEVATSRGKENMSMGVKTLTPIKKDTTDRNRTSPFAFTGNKFEFRMVPSSESISGPNFVLNTIVSDVLCDYADILEKSDNVEKTIKEIITNSIKNHKKIIFNGNGYSNEWVKEAESRGLPNIRTMFDATQAYYDEKNIKLFEKFGILTRGECYARAEIRHEIYSKTLLIESKTMLSMAKSEIKPAVIRFITEVANSVSSLTSIGIDGTVERELLNELNTNLIGLNLKIKELSKATEEAEKIEILYEKAEFVRDNLPKTMKELREYADALELLVDKKYWPFPTYSDILFHI